MALTVFNPKFLFYTHEKDLHVVAEKEHVSPTPLKESLRLLAHLEKDIREMSDKEFDDLFERALSIADLQGGRLTYCDLDASMGVVARSEMLDVLVTSITKN